MKLRLTQKGKQALEANKTLEELGIIEIRTFTGMFIVGLEEIVLELHNRSFQDTQELLDLDDSLLDSPIKSSYLISEGFNLEFIHFV